MIETREIPLVHHVDEKNDSYAGIEEKDKSIDVSACSTAALGFAHLAKIETESSTNTLPLSTKSPDYCNCTLRRGFKPYVAQWWTRASTIDELRCTSHCRALIPNWNRRVGHRTHNI